MKEQQPSTKGQTHNHPNQKVKFIPVVDMNNNPLIPTTPGRAYKWIKSKKATPFFKKGIFCIRLNEKPSNENKQEIVVGIDPGSKKEGITVKSEFHTFLNIQVDAVTHVKDAIETKKILRRSRRNRKTPYRKPRFNRSKSKEWVPPSTKARWDSKLRICKWLMKVFPITHFVVEDIKAMSKQGQKKWNQLFSPLETGKNWFYSELRKLGTLSLKKGFETHQLRTNLGLTKTSNKLSEVFDSHCVDSWVLANDVVGGHIKPDNTSLFCMVPLRFHRRQLHVFNPVKGSIRKKYGGTISMGLKKGSLVKHKKHGLMYVGGSMKERITVHDVETGTRISRYIKPKDCKFRCYNSWRYKLV